MQVLKAVAMPLNITGNSTAAAFITLAEDTDNGTNKVTITAPQTIASDYTLTLPSTAGTVALTSDVDLAKVQLQTQVSASGSSVSFSSIPSGVKRIVMMIDSVSLSGTDTMLIQLGDSGGFETSGYTGAATTSTTGVTTSNLSSGFLIQTNAATQTISGSIIISLMDSATITPATGSLAIDFADAALDGAKVIVWATATMSDGVKFVKNNLRVIGNGTVAAGAITLATSYADKFGLPLAGANISVGVQVVNASGQTGVNQVVKAIV